MERRKIELVGMIYVGSRAGISLLKFWAQFTRCSQGQNLGTAQAGLVVVVAAQVVFTRLGAPDGTTTAQSFLLISLLRYKNAYGI